MNVFIDRLYNIFSAYPIKPKIEGCPCCVNNSKERPLHSLELKELTWEQLSFFIFKTMTTFGDENDFKHFLPRIFELYVTEFNTAPYDVGVLFSKLNYAKWREWPSEEKDTVENAIVKWLQHLSAIGEISILEDIKQDMLTYGFTMR